MHKPSMRRYLEVVISQSLALMHPVPLLVGHIPTEDDETASCFCSIILMKQRRTVTQQECIRTLLHTEIRSNYGELQLGSALHMRTTAHISGRIIISVIVDLLGEAESFFCLVQSGLSTYKFDGGSSRRRREGVGRTGGGDHLPRLS